MWPTKKAALRTFKRTGRWSRVSNHHCAESEGFLSNSKKLADRLPVVDRRHRAAGVVQEVDARVDAQHVVDRGVDVCGVDRAVFRGFAEPVGRADDPAPLTPPPPIRQNMELPQWSRPGVPMLIGGPPLPPSFIRGVRLNSPHSTHQPGRRGRARPGRGTSSTRPRRPSADNLPCRFAGPSDGPSRRSGP